MYCSLCTVQLEIFTRRKFCRFCHLLSLVKSLSFKNYYNTKQGLIQDYQLLVLQEKDRGNQTCSSTVILFSMYILEILERGNPPQWWEIPVLPTLSAKIAGLSKILSHLNFRLYSIVVFAQCYYSSPYCNDSSKQSDVSKHAMDSPTYSKN